MPDQPLPPGSKSSQSSGGSKVRAEGTWTIPQTPAATAVYDPSKDLLLLIWTASFGDKIALDKYILPSEDSVIS